MHYCLLLITKELPSKEQIKKIMDPYYEGNAEYDEETEERLTPYPVFEWDWYQIGGRYNGLLKLKVDENDDYYGWKYYSREGRNERLFYSHLLSEMKKFAKGSLMYAEEDYYGSIGYKDDFLYVDGAKVDDLLNFDDIGCYFCIDADGNAIARDTWNGKEIVKDNDFDEKLEEIKKNSKGMFVTVLDIHD